MLPVVVPLIFMPYLPSGLPLGRVPLGQLGQRNRHERCRWW
jgi:hypothetical protein